MIGTKDITDFFARYGKNGLIAGCFVMLAIIAIPEIKGWFQEYRVQGREDGQQREVNCQTLLQDMRTERNRFLAEATRLREEMAILSAEMRLQKRADYDSQLARWRLNENFQLTWFNRAFSRQVFAPLGVNPNTAYGKTWGELFDPEIAAHANESDQRVARNLRPVSYDDATSVETRGDGKWRVFWRVIKEPLLDDDDIFRGIRGTSDPYKQEKIKE